MLSDTKQALRYYLFSLSNFLAAVGGGMILGKGVATIQIPALQGGSLLAFFVGTVIGLIFLQTTPKRFSNLFARWFSISGGTTSLILFGIFVTYEVNKTLSGKVAILFFILLSLRFGFWFFSRVLRAAAAAGQQQNIAWVEFGYYAGVISGLVIWLLLGIDIGMAYALLLDAFLQFGAGLLDIFANRIPKPLEKITSESKTVEEKQAAPAIVHHSKIWSWRLAIAVMLLTVGVQVIVFNLAHQVSSQFSPYMLAIFYLGAAVSAIFCKKFNIRLEWVLHTAKSHSYAAIFLGKSEINKKLNLLGITVFSALCVAAAIVLVNQHIGIANNQGIKTFCLLALVFIATFSYEILALALLDRIGLEEKDAPQQNMVLRTYGLMSIAAAISLWLLQLVHSSLFYLILTLVGCFLFTFLSIWRRNFSYRPI
ncbi:MAG: hypothetical protein JO149_08815 [Gammaproteobacteria bacterium]|nr:hypothetical protein [Gammaproteobacteria bacterium]